MATGVLTMAALRCNECNKFASLSTDEEPEVEMNINEEGTIGVEVKIVLKCAECETELLGASFDGQIEDKVPAEVLEAHPNGDAHELEVEADSPTITEAEEKQGKRKVKMYGYSMTIQVRCSCQPAGSDPLLSIEAAEATGKDSMDELQ
jgi:phage FluMu protein Com